MYWLSNTEKSAEMEPENEKMKKLNDDVVLFMRKRSETEAPRYTARLKTYVDIQQKRRRAAAARNSSQHDYHDKKNTSTSRKKNKTDDKDKAIENIETPGADDNRSKRSRSGEPSDRCCRRRRRASCPRRRRRCSRRRRRRSCSRRRRRRSCRRRRKRCCPRRRRRC